MSDTPEEATPCEEAEELADKAEEIAEDAAELAARLKKEAGID